MVAINFKGMWEPLIVQGKKRQTIRRTARCKMGDRLHLYTGQRTKGCRLIGTAICQHVESIVIAEDFLATGHWRLPAGDAHAIAQLDGFEGVDSMRNWFRDQYGSLPFEGYRIMWASFEAAER